MSTIFTRQEGPPTPPQEGKVQTVQVHALQAGHLTLPERFFVNPADETARRTVPSLAFLIQHHDPETGHTSRILLDLGIRRSVSRYPEPIQNHIATRQPLTTDPDVTKSLAAGGLTPEDIDYVIYSHVHWDHVGEPRDFEKSTFVVGNGALELLSGSSASLRGSHSFFESDLLPEARTIELRNPYETDSPSSSQDLAKMTTGPNFHQSWRPQGHLPRVLDIFNDGSVLIVDAPGHLPGHINILAKTGPVSSVYLAGDACHDRRIMRKEREIGEWSDAEGHICCIHGDKKVAEQTIEHIRQLEKQGVEVIFAHDVEWEENPQNAGRFFGSK
ncbi:uncharacterized protein HMPREF1541_06755 [Cyphellophora europaea CBS 101466]|uniref:Metallo-beta-lactamase domain-containing protein n=1 Tax=Cyphellophora europaea (strain CBS 101466) TaxID=1220924 RepID=W2RQG8_CYPE1|nr:uncharacterized protein HMPREF1541_06755 [Cyphellophora europaea CBS 101466]ETN38717.1 hypothetical protein HMPREF1541_06755 [Cyphellophora europaea CBS 101466]